MGPTSASTPPTPHMLLELEVVAGHLELEGVGGTCLWREWGRSWRGWGAPAAGGSGGGGGGGGAPGTGGSGGGGGASGAGGGGRHHRLELEGVGVHLHPERDVVAGHLQVIGHVFPI